MNVRSMLRNVAHNGVLSRSEQQKLPPALQKVADQVRAENGKVTVDAFMEAWAARQTADTIGADQGLAHKTPIGARSGAGLMGGSPMALRLGQVKVQAPTTAARDVDARIADAFHGWHSGFVASYYADAVKAGALSASEAKERKAEDLGAFSMRSHADEQPNRDVNRYFRDSVVGRDPFLDAKGNEVQASDVVTMSYQYRPSHQPDNRRLGMNFGDRGPDSVFEKTIAFDRRTGEILENDDAWERHIN